jgi:hypothetical protein
MMLSIRPASVDDVAAVKVLIDEMGTYERLPVFTTEQVLARDGFRSKPEFRVLLAEWDGSTSRLRLVL